MNLIQDFCKKIVSYLVILSLAFSPIVAYPSPTKTAKNKSYKAALFQLNTFMQQLSQLRNGIDRSQFEIDALLEKLNFDADEIIRFVTKDIYFEQYQGLLRGAQGVLMSRAGNALDQAMLLSTLLRAAGYEVWIKKANLSEQQAIALLGKLNTVRPKPTELENNNSNKDIIRQMLSSAEIPTDMVDQLVENIFKHQDIKTTRVYKDAENDATFITSILAANGKTLKERDITNELLAEVKDYFWVEYRLGPADSLKPVHPAFGLPEKQLDGLQAVATYKDRIPQNLQHRFRFQVFIEQKKRNKLIVTPMIETFEYPANELIGKHLVFNNQPDGLKKLIDLKQPELIAKSTKFLIPTFTIDDVVASQMAPFDLSGNTFDKSVLSNGGAAAVVSGMSNSLGNMSSMLQSTGGTIVATKKPEKSSNAVDNSVLSAQWIEYTLIAPGGKETKIKRYTINRISAENRQADNLTIDRLKSREEAIWKLAGTSQFSLSVNHYPKAYIFDRYLQRLLAARHALQQAIHMNYFPNDTVPITPKLLAGLNDNPELWLTAGIDTDIPLGKGEKYYQSEPFLLIYDNEFSYIKKKMLSHSTVDIANRGQRIIRIANDRIYTASQTAILLGAWSTRFEEVNVSGVQKPISNPWNTRKAFKLAKEKKIPIKLVTPDKKEKLNNITGLPARSLHAINRDLDHGYMVIIPEKPVTNDSQVGWWRVNPDSGETLGMIANGLGGSIVEKLLDIRLTIIWSGFFSLVPMAVCMLENSECSNAGCFRAGLVGFASNMAIIYTLHGSLIATIAASYSNAIGFGAFLGARAMDIHSLASTMAPSIPSPYPSCIEPSSSNTSRPRHDPWGLHKKTNDQPSGSEPPSEQLDYPDYLQ